MADYFNKLPIISYGNTYSRNLMAKVAFSKKTKNNLTIFYPYTLKENEPRADIVASKYFDDPFYSWVVYMSNDTVDPYYDLGLTQDQFEQYIIKKYGSLEKASKKILYYRNDWAADESILQISTYDALSSSRKKYYNPVIGYDGRITGYVRKQEDWKVTTNKVYGLSLNSNSTFQVGDHIMQHTARNIIADGIVYITGQAGVVAGRGTVISSNGLYCTVGNIEVDFITGSSTSVSSETDTDNRIRVLDCELLSVNIPDDEIFLWTPVSALDHETELNNQKRNIQLLDNRFVADVESEVKTLLK